MRRRVTTCLCGTLLFAAAPLPAHQLQQQAWTGEEDARPWTEQWSEALLDGLLTPADAAAAIHIEGSQRVIESDGLPDHRTGRFPNRHNPNRIRARATRYRVPALPVYREQTVALGLWPFGVALNGVPFDPGAAEFWRGEPASGWQYEALGGGVDLGLDRHNAHVQPSGAYHYHGLPTALLERDAGNAAPTLIGYAADGFAIYGPLGYRVADDPNSGLVRLSSGYRLRDGYRPGGDRGPGGRYDGAFVQDYVYRPDSGDLDRCNGRHGVTAEYPDGGYYYVVTDRFPFIPRCFHGVPDRSFLRGPGPGGGPPGRVGRPGGGPSVAPPGRAGRPPGQTAGPSPQAPRRSPPPAAIAACNGLREGDRSSLVSPFGDRVTGSCREHRGQLFLVPDRHRPRWSQH